MPAAFSPLLNLWGYNGEAPLTPPPTTMRRSPRERKGPELAGSPPARRDLGSFFFFSFFFFVTVRGLPPCRGQLVVVVAFWDIAIASFVLALLLGVTIETDGGGRKRGRGFASSLLFYLIVWQHTAASLIVSGCRLSKSARSSAFSPPPATNTVDHGTFFATFFVNFYLSIRMVPDPPVWANSTFVSTLWFLTSLIVQMLLSISSS